jgi:hypothetical protein
LLSCLPSCEALPAKQTQQPETAPIHHLPSLVGQESGGLAGLLQGLSWAAIGWAKAGVSSEAQLRKDLPSSSHGTSGISFLRTL